MKILFTNTGPWGTGSFTASFALMKEFIKKGHSVLLFFPNSQESSSDHKEYAGYEKNFRIWQFPIEKDNVKLDTFPLMISDPHPLNPTGVTLGTLPEDQRNLYMSDLKKQLQTIIEEFQPDVIECQHIWAHAYTVAKLNLPYFCCPHNSDQIAYTQSPSLQPMCNLAANQATKIFAISRGVKKNVLKLYSVPEANVTVTTNGFDEEIYKFQLIDYKQLKLDIPDNAYLVSFAGKLSKTKGLDTLLEANALLPPNEEIHFLILGSGNLDTFIDKSDPKYSLDRVHFLGHKPPSEVARVHNASNLAVLPSRSEGFAISAIEAMACGLPHVITRCGGTEDYVVGTIINPEDPKALAQAILDMKHHPDPALKQQCLEKAAELSWSHIADLRLKAYQEGLIKRPT